MLSGDEKPVPGPVVRYPIHHIGVVIAFCHWKDSREVDHAKNFARRWIDPCDELGPPDIGEDLAFHVLQFVQLVDRPPSGQNLDTAFRLEAVWIKKSEHVAPIAHDKPLSVR